MNLRKVEVYGEIEKFIWIPYIHRTKFKEEYAQMYYGYIWSISFNFLCFNITILENK